MTQNEITQHDTAHLISGLKELGRRWQESESLIKKRGARPPWSAYQLACAEEIDALIQFCETHLGQTIPNALAMGHIALMRLATSDQADQILLTEKMRQDAQRGERYDSTAFLKARAAVAMQMMMDAGHGRKKASASVANAISKGGYSVSGRTVESWRDGGNNGKPPFGDRYHRLLAQVRNVHSWRDNPFGSAPAIDSIDNILAKLSLEFSALPAGFGGDRR